MSSQKKAKAIRKMMRAKGLDPKKQRRMYQYIKKQI